jgi:hypothetical protein
MSSNVDLQIRSLTERERQVFKTKTAAPAFATISPSDRLKAAEIALVSICIVTGWSYPEDERVEKLLVSEFAAKLGESYRMLNLEEIKFAVRNGSARDWGGKQINLGMVDELIQVYLNERRQVERFIESKTLALPPPAEEITNEDLWEAYSIWVPRGQTQPHFIPEDLYWWAIQTGRMAEPSKDEKTSIYQRAVNIAAAAGDEPTREHLQTLSRQLAVYTHLKKQSDGTPVEAPPAIP